MSTRQGSVSPRFHPAVRGRRLRGTVLAPAWAQLRGRLNLALPPAARLLEKPIGERFAQFVMPPDLAVMNAANLCPASRPVLDALTRETANVDRDPSPHNRARLSGEGEHAQGAGRVPARHAGGDRHHAQHQRVEQPRLERPRSQGRRRGHRPFDNHPSNLNAWHEKAKRFGFSVVTVEQKNPHPGPDYYLDAFPRRSRRGRGHLLHASHQHGRRSDAGAQICAAGARAAAC